LEGYGRFLEDMPAIFFGGDVFVFWGEVSAIFFEGDMPVIFLRGTCQRHVRTYGHFGISWRFYKRVMWDFRRIVPNCVRRDVSLTRPHKTFKIDTLHIHNGVLKA